MRAFLKMHLPPPPIPVAGLLVCACSGFFTTLGVSAQQTQKPQTVWHIPPGYLDEAKDIPAFWITTSDEIADFINKTVRKGRVKQIGVSAGGRPIRAVFYGAPRSQDGSSTFSGALSLDGKKSLGPDWPGAHRGSDAGKKVFVGLGGVHGFELEGIMGIINLIAVLETGRDLNGGAWPEIARHAQTLDRIILIPLVNPDGRARVPIRMETYKGGEPDSFIPHEYLNTGGHKDGTLIGWPAVKRYIPMRFDDFGFPGGYPNDAGVNIMHDDFLGNPQPETRTLLALCGHEKPDLILNMHTGVGKNDYFMQVHRPFTEPGFQPVFDALYRRIKTALTRAGLQGSGNVAAISNPARVRTSGFNLDTALNLHCGALCVVIESPSHSFSGKNRAGLPAVHPPERLLKAQLTAHQEALAFLAETGGLMAWEAARTNHPPSP